MLFYAFLLDPSYIIFVGLMGYVILAYTTSEKPISFLLVHGCRGSTSKNTSNGEIIYGNCYGILLISFWAKTRPQAIIWDNLLQLHSRLSALAAMHSTILSVKRWFRGNFTQWDRPRSFSTHMPCRSWWHHCNSSPLAAVTHWDSFTFIVSGNN